MDHAAFPVFVNVNKNRMELHACHCTKNQVAFFWKSLFFQEHFRMNYSRTSRILAFTLLFPPVGSARALPHTRQSTLVAVFPNIICSFLHLGHLILMNLLVDSLIFAISTSIICNLKSFIYLSFYCLLWQSL